MAFFPISPIPQGGGNFLSSMHTYFFSWCALSPTKVMIAYCQDNPIKLYVQIINFNGNSPPTMGPATYMADIIGTPANVVVKLDAFDSTNVGIVWCPSTANGFQVSYNMSVLNVDGSDNITWNPPASYTETSMVNATCSSNFKCLGATNATVQHYNGSVMSVRRVTRAGNVLTINAPTTLSYSLSNFYISGRKLPTSGVMYSTNEHNGGTPGLSFTNSTSVITSIAGVSGSLPGSSVFNVVSDNLVHSVRSAAGAISVRPLNLNLGAGTGNWITSEQGYSIANWPAGTILDVVPIDSEYFMVLSCPSTQSLPSSYSPVAFSFVVGRYNTSTQSYVFAPTRFNAPTTAQPLWFMKHLHLINSNTIACFTIQGTTTARVLGVKLLYL